MSSSSSGSDDESPPPSHPSSPQPFSAPQSPDASGSDNDRGSSQDVSDDEPTLQPGLFQLSLHPATLPPLDAVNFKVSQIVDSIAALQRLVEADGDRSMATWPDILSKYNMLLGQTHILSHTLAAAIATQDDHPDPRTRRPPLSTLPRLVLHPTSTTPDDLSVDFRVETLLRTIQLPEMVEGDNAIVSAYGEQPAEDEDLQEAYAALNHIRVAHDDRVARASERVRQLRDQYDWKTRITITREEERPQSTLDPPATHSSNVRGSAGITANEAPESGIDSAMDAEDGDEDDMEGGDQELFGDVTMREDVEGSEAGTNTSDEAFLLEAELEDAAASADASGVD